MFEDLSRKFGILKMPDGSLIKKHEKIKKSDLLQQEIEMTTRLLPEMMEQIKKVPQEISRKIDEVETKKINLMKTSSDNVKNLEEKIYKLDQTVFSTKKGTEEFNVRLDKTDKTVMELLSLYGAISKAIDPINGKMMQIDKKIEAIYNKPPQITLAQIEEFNSKFKTLEKNMEELKKTVETKAIDENAFVDKVAEMVVERMRSRRKQRMYPGAPIAQKVESPVPPVPTSFSAPRYISESEEEVRLPYLDNRSETSIILLNWIEFLMEKVGRNNLAEVLEYYIEIGWINEEVCSIMMSYASGIDYFVERPSWKLLPEDHTKSLLFIEQLLGNKVDRMVFSRLERDVNRIIRNNSEITVH